MAKYRKENPDKVKYWRNKSNQASNAYWKRKVVELYSNGTMQCARCRFGDIRALSIDHINGRTKEDREIRDSNPRAYYKRVIQENNKAKYQVLCMNCQWIKRHEKKEYNHYYTQGINKEG